MNVKYKNRPLKDAFEKADMSWAQLAVKAGYTEAWARAILSGKLQEAPQRTINAFAKALKVAVESVLAK